MVFSRYYRYKLSTQHKIIYDDLVAGMISRINEVKTKYVSSQDASLIIHAVNYDNPQLYYVDFSKITVIQSMGTSKILISYLIDECFQGELDRKLKDSTAGIFQNVAGKTMKQASLIVHDWLVCNCKYEEYYDVLDSSHNIIGALVNHKCVCEGYAKAYKYLADLIRMRSLVVAGNGIHPDGTRGEHAWNIVMLNKQCFHVDVTFDKLFAGKYCSRAYFLLTTKEILFDHSINAMFEMPECLVESQVLQTVSGTADLIKFLKDQYYSGVTHSEVRLTKGFSKQRLFSMMKKKLTVKDVDWYNQIDAIWYGDNCRTLFVCWK